MVVTKFKPAAIEQPHASLMQFTISPLSVRETARNIDWLEGSAEAAEDGRDDLEEIPWFEECTKRSIR